MKIEGFLRIFKDIFFLKLPNNVASYTYPFISLLPVIIKFFIIVFNSNLTRKHLQKQSHCTAQPSLLFLFHFLQLKITVWFGFIRCVQFCAVAPVSPAPEMLSNIKWRRPNTSVLRSWIIKNLAIVIHITLVRVCIFHFHRIRSISTSQRGEFINVFLVHIKAKIDIFS